MPETTATIEVETSMEATYWTDLDAFTQGYIEALFFTNTEPSTTRDDHPREDVEEGRISELPGDYGFADLAPEALARIIADCADFQAANEALLESAYGRTSPARVIGDGTLPDSHRPAWDYDAAAAGRDFWYTHNGHGCGFWDQKALEDDSEQYETLTAAMVEASRSGDNAAWDRHLAARNALTSESIGEKLTKASKAFRETDVYLGDDGKVYLS